jgi:hypothetical protein
VKTELKSDFKVFTHVRTNYENWNQKFFFKKNKLDGFSCENPNPILKV